MYRLRHTFLALFAFAGLFASIGTLYAMQLAWGLTGIMAGGATLGRVVTYAVPTPDGGTEWVEDWHLLDAGLFEREDMLRFVPQDDGGPSGDGDAVAFARMRFRYEPPPSRAFIESLPDADPPGSSRLVFQVRTHENDGTPVVSGALYRVIRTIRGQTRYVDHWMLFENHPQPDDPRTISLGSALANYASVKDFLLDMNTLGLLHGDQEWRYVRVAYRLRSDLP